MMKPMIRGYIKSVIGDMILNGSSINPPLPPFPSGFSEYWNAYDSALVNTVTGVNIDAWTGTSVVPQILAQATSADQPSFIENDVTTQSIVTSQPKLDYDKIVTQDVLASQPTLINTGEELAVGFDGVKSLRGLSVVAGQTFEFTISRNVPFVYLTSENSNYGRGNIILNGNSFRIYDNAGNLYFVATISNDLLKHKYTLTLDLSSNISIYEDDSLVGSALLVGGFDIDNIGRNGDVGEWNLYEFKQWDTIVADPTNITETPDFELLPTVETMRKDDGSEPSVGDSISGWKATGAELAVNFDGLNDNLSYIKDFGSNNFTYEIDYDMSSVTTGIKVFLGGTSNIRIDSSTIFRLKSNEGSFYVFNGTDCYGKNKVKYERNGNSFSVYQNDILLNTVDVTGQTFSFDIIGAISTVTIDGNIYFIKQWNSADSSGTPDFELLPTVETIPSGIGNPMPKWYATSHNKYHNRVRKTATQYMDDYPIQTGDQSHVIRSDYEIATGSANYPVSSASFDGLGTWYYRLTNDVFRGSTGLSMVSYIYLDALTGTRTVFAEASASGTIRINFGTNGNKLRFNTRTANVGYLTYTGTEILTVGWNTIGVTQAFNGSGAEGVTLYTNGVAEFFATGGVTGIETTNTGMPTSIGTWNYNTSGAHSQNFNGDISFVRISNTDVWDASEVAEALTTPAKDIGAISAPMTFAMDCSTYTGSAGAFIDQIGSNDGTEIGTPSYIDNALTIDVEASGVTNYPVNSASYTTSTYSKFTNPIAKGRTILSMAMRVYLPDLSGSQTIFGESRNTGGNDRCTLRKSNGILNYVYSTDVELSSTKSVSSGTQVGWNDIGLTHDVTTGDIKIYVNGVISSFSGTPATNFETSAYDVPSALATLLYTTGGSRYSNFTGDISFIRWSTSNLLSDAEMLALMADPSKDLTGLGVALVTKLTGAVDSATYTGSVGALVDQIGTNDLTEVGAVAYVDNGLTIDVEASGSLKKDLSHSTLPSYVGVNASNQFVLTSDLGTVFTFATTTIDTENRAKVWVVRGNDLEFWLDAVLIETKDFTGETLTLDRYGAPTDSSTGDTEYIVPFTDAISQSDIEYFNYLRDDLTNEIILVDGEPLIVS